MFNLRHAEDTLDDIKKIICYYSDSIDYTVYIQELESIIGDVEAAKNSGAEVDLAELLKIENRAKLYLARTKTLQARYENQESSEA